MREASSRRGRGQTFDELRDLQRKTLAAIRLPLTPARRLPSTFPDGRPTRQVLAEFIKPNDRLTPFERVEIYGKSYWFRLLDCLYDDYPGLRAVLGERKFFKLRVAYLDRYPSTSYTLRNLGSRLVRFITEEPQWTAPHQRMALDMARFEWAQVVAFDGPALPALTPEDLLGRDPARLRLGVQPYLSLLELAYPLDDFVIAVKRQSTALRSEASNAVDEERFDSRPRAVRLPRPKTVHLVVHRFENDLYYKRIPVEAYRLLAALRVGATVEKAIGSALGRRGAAYDWAATLQDWFKSWMELGWFCKPERGAGR